MTKYLNNLSIFIAVGIFLIFSLWWVSLQIFHIKSEEVIFQAFGALYGLIALYGGIWGLFISRRWGGIRSVLGKSILFFSFGLLCQEIGQLAYSYYVAILHIPVPYPSIGDYFFWATVPFYIIAVIYLAKASGVHISLRSMTGKTQAILIPMIVLVFCYVVFLQKYQFDWSKPVIILIDLGVPIGEAIYISLALLTYILTRGILGGVMKNKVLLILVALLAEYIADWTFLYQVSRDIWSAGGINDYMYLVAYSLMALALLNLNTQSIKKHLD